MKKFFPALSVIIGIYCVYSGLFVYELWVRRGPGGGFMPVLGGGLAIIFGIMAFIANSKDKSPSGFSWKAFIPVAALIGLILGSYVFGLIISIAIYIFLWLKFMEKYNVAKSVVTGVTCAAILYGIFVAWLKVPLPSGIFELL
ncbi:tripartite tricarboxylate transporter TctB family protein [Petroclostridium sp. X23]|uniref:tripartite tricarboxylate transporter TctB family protein n=1 Tax=Petroclostridium sp. X23 TaxID=3045146 RepID=UPI0024AE18A8|nr:tripartite tricarboxylate transporter TctB family protein [Petroclostridium sp. X23]WHH60353.1 tripartite tricarboxylate transporter TctB family protein [Petroclostridium sp. X23]